MSRGDIVFGERLVSEEKVSVFGEDINLWAEISMFGQCLLQISYYIRIH